MAETQVAYTEDGDWALDAPPPMEFEPMPEGMHNAVCVEVVPPTLRKDFHGNPSAQTRLVFAVEAVNKEGKQFTASTRWMAIKTHKKSNMGKILREWLEKDFPSDADLAAKKFRMKGALEGRLARLMVEHEKDEEGRIWVRILKVKPGTVKVVPDGKYVRTTEREDAVPPADVNAELEDAKAPF